MSDLMNKFGNTSQGNWVVGYYEDTIMYEENSCQRNGNIYSAEVTAFDGRTASSWADFQDWYLEITDPNDLDSDGIPDLSDSINEMIVFFETIGTDLGGKN